MNKNLIKWVVIFGGGLLGFALLKPKKADLKENKVSSENQPSESFDSTDSSVKPSKENAEIVASAYSAAMQAGEPTSKLTELNKECMKEYGMRCYMDTNNKLIVCDSSGTIILSK